VAQYPIAAWTNSDSYLVNSGLFEKRAIRMRLSRRGSHPGRRALRIIFVLGMGLMLMAPLLRRYRIASYALAGGAFVILVVSLNGLAHLDPRFGEGAIASDRRYYHFFLACELPVLILALISQRYFKWAFWIGWTINLALALYLTLIAIWLEFFWHW
jgi:hypothetical protein